LAQLASVRLLCRYHLCLYIYDGQWLHSVYTETASFNALELERRNYRFVKEDFQRPMHFIAIHRHAVPPHVAVMMRQGAANNDRGKIVTAAAGAAVLKSTASL
jgi:hypothetical protein